MKKSYYPGICKLLLVIAIVITAQFARAQSVSYFYGKVDFDPNPSTPGLVYTSSNTAVATIVNSMVHIVGVGTDTISWTLGGTAHSETIHIKPATLNITANSQTGITGYPLPPLTLTYKGFVYSDGPGALSPAPTVSTTATSSSGTGSYPITASGAGSANYAITYIDGTMNMEPYSAVSAPIPVKTYGAADFFEFGAFAAGVSYTSDNTAVAKIVGGKVRIVGTGTANITAANGINHITKTLTVNPAPLTITAVSVSKAYGSANPALSVTYSGFVNGDTSISTPPVVTTTATASSPAGTYPITPGGGADANYAITYVPGTLTVNTVNLTITADNQTGVSGYALPPLTLSYSGFVNSDGPSVLSPGASLSTTATDSSAVGTYPIMVSGAASPNYNITYVDGTMNLVSYAFVSQPIPVKTYGDADFYEFGGVAPGVSYTSSDPDVATIVSGKIHIVGAGTSNITTTSGSEHITKTLTVNQATLTISVANETRIYGTPDPTPVITYTGFVNGDNNITSPPKLNDAATESSPVGKYNLTLSGAGSANYAISYVQGKLTITPASLVITANSATKRTGNANPALTINYSGFVNGDTPASLTTQPTISTTATMSSPAGYYPISVSGAASANYAISYNPGAITALGNAPVISYSLPAIDTLFVGTPVTITPTNTGGAVPATTYAGKIWTAGMPQIKGSANGQGDTATFGYPQGLTTDLQGNVYVADAGNNLIRKITPDNIVSTYAGTGVAGSANGISSVASFNDPVAVATDAAGNVYVSDQGNNLIRKISTSGVVTTLAGSGLTGSANGAGIAASFNYPSGIATDTADNVYVADSRNNLIRKIAPDGVVSTFAGSGASGYTDGTGTAAVFSAPTNLSADLHGNLYVNDSSNDAIRKITPAAVVSLYTFSSVGRGSITGFGPLATDPIGNLYIYYEIGEPYISLNGTNNFTNNPGEVSGMAADIDGNVYTADDHFQVILKYSATGYFMYPFDLPNGLSFDSATGVISGTPTAVKAARTFQISAFNTGGSSTYTITLQVVQAKKGGIAAIDSTASLFANVAGVAGVAGSPLVSAALSPNGDGKNDVLTIANIEKYPDNKVTLINSGGVKIFEATGYDNVNIVFNGRANNSTLQQPGTYYYLLQYKDNGVIKSKSGYFVIKY